MSSRHLKEHGQVIGWHPHQTQEDGRRERGGELQMEITSARIDELVEQAVDQRAHHRLELADPLWG